MVERLYGRETTIRIIHEVMLRSAETATADGTGHPVVVLEGASGSGRTSVLRALAGLFRHRLPCTSVRDLEELEGRTADEQVPKLLAAITYDLQRRWPGYGTIRFPRLIIGHKVMKLELDTLDKAKARSQLDAALREWRGLNTAKKTLRDAAGDVLAALPAGRVVAPASLVDRLLDASFDLLVAWGPLRRPFLGSGQAWYGHQDRGLPGASADTLIELNQWAAAAPESQGAQQSINDLLLRAFLADLRANFAGRGSTTRRRFSCVVLLDTADCGLGQAFLGKLVRTRSELYNDGQTTPDPLTVIATSEGALLSGRNHIRTVTQSVRRGEEIGDGGEREVWWIRHPLVPLTLGQVEAMVRDKRLHGGNVHQLAAKIHKRLDGHPAGTRALLDQIPADASANVDLDALPPARPDVPADTAFPAIVRNTSDFDPPAANRRRRRLTLVTAGIVALAAMGYGVTEVAPHTCRLPRIDTSLSKVHGECVGVTDEHAYAFAPELGGITKQIAAQNRWVAKQHAPYVKIALMMPMTSGPTAAMTNISTVVHSLEGAFTGQIRANGEYGRIYGTPHVQLLLASEGKNEDQWHSVAKQLEGMTHGAHPLVAVVGMGISIPATGRAADELSANHIAVFGAVLSATRLAKPGTSIDELTPSNQEYADALAHYLAQHPAQRKGGAFMVHDKRDDNYVKTLAEAFETTFPHYHLDVKETSFVGSTGSYLGTAADFHDAVSDICINQSSLVFYAGRDRDLTNLVQALDARAPVCRSMKPITILTGATGVALQSDAGLQQEMKAAHVTLVDASATDVPDWLRDPPQQFAQFLQVFHNAGFRDDALADGYAIMHHDAVTAAITAIKAAHNRTTIDVFNSVPNLKNQNVVPGASGNVSFTGSEGGWPHGRQIPVSVTPATHPGPATVYTTP